MDRASYAASVTDPLLHRYASNRPNDVTGHFKLRCGVVGAKDRTALPRPEKVMSAIWMQGKMYCVAMNELVVTCPRCKLRVTPNERKALRLMLDYPSVRTVKFISGCRKFDWHQGSELRIYAREDMFLNLVMKGLVIGNIHKGAILTYDGKTLAASYPKVKDEWKK